MIFWQGSLVSIKNRKVNDFIAGLVASRQTIWIGASRSPTNRKQFQWIDAATWLWSYWSPKEPNDHGGKESCTLLSFPKKKWNDMTCNNKYAIVCQTGGKCCYSLFAFPKTPKMISINLENHTSFMISPSFLETYI